MRIILAITLILLNFAAFSTPSTLDSILANQADLPQAPLPMSALFRHAVGPPKIHQIQQGHISLVMEKRSSKLQIIKSELPRKSDLEILPNINFSWVSNESGEVIPEIRHLILSDNPNWDFFVGVGEFWASSGDTPSNRISLPLTIVEKNENCVHNGILVIDVSPQASSNQFYYQISSETCAYFKADFWGTGNAKHSISELPSQHAVIVQYAAEKAHRLTTAALQELAEKAPNMHIDNLALPQQIALSDMTTFGVVHDDIHYVSSCHTRAGDYPFCDQLVLPSYSTAKSLFAGLTMLYLEKRYGDVFTQPVSNWVKQCNSKRWQGVTLAHLLDMTTGNYDSAKYAVDEASADKLRFFNAKTNQQRVAFACEHYPRQSAPGKTFVYHSSDTYLLGLALNNFIKSKLGENADIFTDVLYKQIFQPLGLSQISAQTRRTQDNLQQPYSGYGLFFNRDDLVRLAGFVQQQARLKDSASMLSSQHLSAALQEDSNNRGATTDYSYIRYQHGFWARKVDANTHCDTQKWIPFMSGFGGITLALLAPSNLYYYVSDSYQFNWTQALTELNKLNKICAD